MSTALRTLAAIFVGMLVAFAVVFVVELFSNVVHPFPPDYAGTTEEICKHVERYPTWVLAVVVPAWAFMAFAGTWTAKKIGNLLSFAFVGLLVLAALVLNISMLPYPMWFKVANLLAMPAAMVAAGRLFTRGKTAAVGASNEPPASDD